MSTTKIDQMHEHMMKLIQECNDDIKDSLNKMAEIYDQYDISPSGIKDPQILAIIGGHMNKTAELILKGAGEKARLADLIHKISSEQAQLEIAEIIAKERIKSMSEDAEMESILYSNQDDDDEEEDYEALMEQNKIEPN